MHLQSRTNDLHLYGISGLDEIITLQLKHSKSTLSYNLVFHLLISDKSNIIFENEKLIVETIPLRHKIPCCGFLFREKDKPKNINKEKLTEEMRLQDIATLKTGKDVYNEAGELLYANEYFTLPPKPCLSYAYCSDTAYNELMVPQISEVNLLYHEATFTEEHSDKARDTLHSTARQAATIAAMAKVKHLLIGHYSARYRDLDELHREATAIFPSTRLAIEGETVDLETL
jgi:ribonuclease Z